MVPFLQLARVQHFMAGLLPPSQLEIFQKVLSGGLLREAGHSQEMPSADFSPWRALSSTFQMSASQGQTISNYTMSTQISLLQKGLNENERQIRFYF
jgi:hypothetical protein